MNNWKFFLVDVSAFQVECATVRNIFDIVCANLEKGGRYVSVVGKDGKSFDDLTKEDFIIVDNGGSIDVVETAKLVVFDLLLNTCIIYGREEEEIKTDYKEYMKTKYAWIDEILKG